MMWKKKSSKWAFAKCLYALPLAFVALSAFAAPVISERLSEISSVKDIQISLQQDIKPQTPPLPPPVPPTAVSVPPAVVPVPEQDTLVPMAIVEIKPLFVNGQGEEAFTRWVFEHLKYPAEAKTKGIQGKVIASFVIDTDGYINDVRIVRGADPLLDDEAVRVLESSPKWERPGMVKDKKVRVKYNFPLNFALGNNPHIQVRPSSGPQDIEIEPAVFANGKGENEFVLWVFKQITYPKIAKEQGIQGKVVASYELSEDGTVTNAKILRGVDPSIDAEAIRVLESSPKWEKPAMKNGKPVKVSYVIPLNFQLMGTSKEQINEEHVKVLDDVFVVGYGEQKTKLNDPLYIVNGAEVKDIKEIDPNTIESIEVLKNEAAVQQYGEKGRNGVIIVKLKEQSR